MQTNKLYIYITVNTAAQNMLFMKIKQLKNNEGLLSLQEFYKACIIKPHVVAAITGDVTRRAVL